MAYNHELYMHDLDRKATAALNIFPKFTKLVEAYKFYFNEKAAKINMLSNAIRLSENQMPEIYNQLPPICDKLGIEVPELYYVKARELNAYTYGSINPYICLSSRLVDKLKPELISSVLAHECGHIACKHTLFHSMAVMLINGIDSSPLIRSPKIKRLLSPALISALEYWERCSELSADRASVLCDGTSDNTIDVLLKVNGYDKNINRDEFIKQAMDLDEYVNKSGINKVIEGILNLGEEHPFMTVRAYECYKWSQSEQFQGIIDGTYTLHKKKKGEDKHSEREVIYAQLSLTSDKPHKNNIVPKEEPEKLPQAAFVSENTALTDEVADIDRINQSLQKVNSELERYINNADKSDYALAVGSGILAGAADSLFFGDCSILDNDIRLSNRQVNNFIQSYAKSKGYDDERLKDSIRHLEENFKVAQDNVWKGAGIDVSTRNHHLADLAHHPTPVGLIAALIVHFLRFGTFVNREGEWHFIPVETTKKDMAELLVPAIITGVLNWLVWIGSEKAEEDTGTEIPEALIRTAHIIASSPILLEVVKCIDNWFSHLVSDMGGSKTAPGAGMGIPGVFLSMFYEISSLPVLKDTGLPQYLDKLYEKQKQDFRRELHLYKALGKQAIPVIFNEILVRAGYFITHLFKELSAGRNISWSNVIPFGNHTINRMLTISSMAFTAADTADSAIHAAIESGANWVLFSCRFIARFNYVGAGRAAIAVVKEISDMHNETQLLLEKMMLSEEKAQLFYEKLQQFKAELEQRVSDYLAEDITAFMSGFDYMSQGFSAGDSDLVIKGNVIIQKVLGREPQFETQKEFDELMASDAPLIL